MDGGEGSGKTTFVKFLKEKYTDGSFVFTREPGGSPLAEKIRDIILSGGAKQASAETMFALFWAARGDHMKNVIVPALESGKNVVCDRFDSSTYAYQIYAQGGEHLRNLFEECRKVFLGKNVPDLYIFFDVEPVVGLSRVESRGEKKTHFDEQQINFHERVREGIREFISNKPHAIVDASQSIDKVRQDGEVIINKLTHSAD